LDGSFDLALAQHGLSLLPTVRPAAKAVFEDLASSVRVLRQAAYAHSDAGGFWACIRPEQERERR
jgi:hypothetical protein